MTFTLSILVFCNKMSSVRTACLLRKESLSVNALAKLSIYHEGHGHCQRAKYHCFSRKQSNAVTQQSKYVCYYELSWDFARFVTNASFPNYFVNP